MAKSLIPKTDLRNIYSEIAGDLSNIFLLYKKGDLKSFEVAGLYILLFYFAFRPKNWKGSQLSISPSATPSIYLQDIIPRLSFILHDPITLIDFFSTYRLKNVPESAHRALVKWADGEFPLILKTHVPNALQVLDLQKQNQRVVTTVKDPLLLCDYILGERDPMSFVIHDLVHADHFFKDPEVRNEQLGFYIKMSNAYNRGCFCNYLEDSQFLKDFEYLISDMNSVSLHLLMSFKTILMHAFLRKAGLPESHKMNLELKAHFEFEFQKILVAWELPENIWPSFLRLNEETFCQKFDGALISEYFKKIPWKESLSSNFRQL